MKSKVVTREEALSRIHDGQTIMFGDWHGEFAADEIIDGMLEKGIKDIDAIAVSAGMADQGVGKLIKDHRVKSLITTHIGLNPIAKDQMFAGELAIEFSPQGTFAERIRCGGAGLGGCLTPTGLGTEVEEGKQKLTIDGKEYLLELPLRADVALIKATKADTAGNISFRMNSRATNSTMAMAADTVIVEVEEIVEVGELGPEEIDVPAPVIDMIYERTGEKRPMCPMWQRAKAKRKEVSDMAGLTGRKLIASRCAKFFKDGDFVNLGIGVPLMCVNYLPEGVDLWLEAEIGTVGSGPTPSWDKVDIDVIDAGGQPASVIKGGSVYDHEMSFAFIRGGHIDAAVLGTLQVDQEGNIANWTIPGKMVPGMGGAMDLCAGVKKIIVATDHCEKSGKSKILKKCTLPLTGVHCVTDIVTERCYFEVTKDGLVLRELAEGYSVEDILACTEADVIVPDEIGVMS